MDAPLVAIAMTHLPTAGLRNRKYLVYWRAYYKNTTQPAATLDLDSRMVRSVYMFICAPHYAPGRHTYMYMFLLCMSELLGAGPKNMTMNILETYKMF